MKSLIKSSVGRISTTAAFLMVIIISILVLKQAGIVKAQNESATGYDAIDLDVNGNIVRATLISDSGADLENKQIDFYLNDTLLGSGLTNAEGFVDFPVSNEGVLKAVFNSMENETMIGTKAIPEEIRTTSTKVEPESNLGAEQQEAEINKPVRWVMKSKGNARNLAPEKSFNVSVQNENTEYYTDAPRSYETVLSKYRKLVTVSSDIDYTNIKTYTSIEDAPRSSIRLFWLEGDKRIDVTYDPLINLTLVDTNGNGLIDRLEWITPHTSNQTFEVSIIVINPYTYLRNGDNWIVAFNTTGQADLTIDSTNANWTEFLTDNPSTEDEMKFLDIGCGNTSLKDSLELIDENDNVYNYSQLTESDSIKIKKLLIKDYSCDENGYLSNEIFKAGYANLQFSFGGQTAYAYDPDFTPCKTNITWTDNYTYNATSNNTYYCLNQSWFIAGKIAINFTNIQNSTLDCLGYSITGNKTLNTYGTLLVTSSINNTVKNCNFTNFYYGIYITTSSNNNTVFNNVINGSSSRGINIGTSNYTNITSNTANYNSYGIFIATSYYDSLVNNTANSNTNSGIGFYSAVSNSTIINSTANYNGVDGIHLGSSNFNNLTNNTIIGTNGNSEDGVYLSNSYNNSITGGSVFSNSGSGGGDYYLSATSVSGGMTNNFTNTNFTGARTINFIDVNSWFNYQNDSTQNLWLDTNVSTAVTINRTLNSWNKEVMSWNDSLTSGTAMANYNLTGLSASTTYYVYNASVLIWTLTSDSIGNLKFNISLSTTSNEIRVNTTTTQPTYSLNSTNSTVAGTPVLFSLKWTAVTGVDKAITSLWNGSSWVNATSWCTLSTYGGWCNQTLVVNSTVGTQLWWKQYANNTYGVWNTSENFSLVTTTPPSISSCTIINAPGTYNLTADINSATTPCINIQTTNVNLDCQNHNINFTGAVGDGVGIQYQPGVTTNGYNTIKNCNITNYNYGISFGDSGGTPKCTNLNNFTNITTNSMISLVGSNNTFTNISIATTNTRGIGISGGSGSCSNGFNNLVNINVSRSTYGIQVGTTYNNLKNIIANNNYYGVDIGSAEQNIIANITVYNNSYGILLGFNNNVTNINATNNTYGVYILNSNNIIANSSIQNSTYGIYMDNNVNGNTIYNNLLNQTNNVYFYGTISTNYWNTTNQTGTRILYSANFSTIGGNYWTNSTNNGYSDTCTDSNGDGFCDNAYDVTTGTSCTPGVNCSLDADYLPLAKPAASDTSAPTYASNASQLITTYSPTGYSNFSITWNDNSGSVNAYLENNFSGSLANTSMLGSYPTYTYNSSSLKAGAYQYRFVANDSSGNTNATPMLTFTIAKASDQVNLYLNNTQGNYTYAYPQATNATGTATAGTALLWRDGSSKGNPEQVLLGNGTYAYKVNTSGNENYSTNNTGVTYYALVNKGTSALNVYIDGAAANKTVSYPTTVNASGNSTDSGNSDCTYTLYRNGTALATGNNAWNVTSLGNGTYTFYYNTSGTCTNYTLSTSQTLYLWVNKGTTTATLYLNGSVTDVATSVYPNSTINATATSSLAGLYVQLWHNGTLIDNVTSTSWNITQWAAYPNNFSAQVLGNANYSSSALVTLWWNVSKGGTNTTLYLNGTQNNFNYNVSDMANFTVNLNVSNKNVNLYSNYTGWTLQTLTAPFMNYTTLNTAGKWWNLTAYFVTDENYSASSQTYWFNVSSVSFNVTLPNNIAYSSSLNGGTTADEEFNATASTITNVSPYVRTTSYKQNSTIVGDASNIANFIVNNTGDYSENITMCINASLSSKIAIWGTRSNNPYTSPGTIPACSAGSWIANSSLSVNAIDQFWIWTNFTVASTGDFTNRTLYINATA